FSSRRRHTRFSRDWSSDVCSSDLIHPSLLPRHPGLDTHARALAAGDRDHGASVHVVTPVLDAGPVLAQAHVGIGPGDTPESLAARLLPREHALLTACVALIAAGRL